MRGMLRVAALMWVMSVILAVSQVSAGPCFIEPGGTDAGSLPTTAMPTTGVGTIQCIRGKWAAPAETPGDFEDMYIIFINDPLNFCAKTVISSDMTDCCGGPWTPSMQYSTNFNTQLWVFRSNGHGALANDDRFPIVPPGLSGMGHLSNDGSGEAITTPGIYYIAISGGPNRDPVDHLGQLIFNQASTTEVSGPDGLGGLAMNPIANWTGSGATNVQYEIVLCGAQFMPNVPTMSGVGLATMIATCALGGVALIVKRRQQQLARSA
jgi:hypothetical protein